MYTLFLALDFCEFPGFSDQGNIKNAGFYEATEIIATIGLVLFFLFPHSANKIYQKFNFLFLILQIFELNTTIF